MMEAEEIVQRPDTDQWVTGSMDLQVNGYQGVDFNDPTTSISSIQFAAKAMRSDSVAAALPTIITAAPQVMIGCIANVRQAIESDAEVAQIFRGLHIEGPFLSRQPGFIGAHPSEHARAQDFTLLAELLDAGGGLVRLLTLAPEIDVDGRMTAYCVERGVTVAAGHTDADLAQLDRCIACGLSLFTHLGNGCPRQMDRHDNIIYRALRRADKLHYTLIADGFHVPETLFRNLLQWVPRQRLAVVSDAISAAGLGPGTYQLGHRTVTIGADRAARDPSGEHFVGAASTMRDADRWLAHTLALPLSERRELLQSNPAAWMSW
ncbi:MAG: N-acetylglucosamine-6-phosphate deacetylase [Pirellulaceae bacterium]|nr:N-acetylglucosamine-6-phosphate deacetylase [Pirellulaceae bacterium]